jgi:predicted metal-dependent hydrolase
MTAITSASRMPEGMTLEVRNIEFDLNKQLSKDWLDNDPFKTAFFNALSMSFPAGERFFIDSVRHFRDKVKDPKLKQEISRFIGQEAMHSREHKKYNQMLCEARGYSQRTMEGRTEAAVRLGEKKLSREGQLAMTCGVEHLTAILADKILKGWMLCNVEPKIRSLWEWHAAEELEHKSVAFDVYMDIGGNYKARKRTLRIFTVNFLLDLLANTTYMLRKDKKLWKWSTLKSGLNFLFAKGGVLREMRSDYLMYFDSGFHPWDDDNRDLLERWQPPETA